MLQLLQLSAFIENSICCATCQRHSLPSHMGQGDRVEVNLCYSILALVKFHYLHFRLIKLTVNTTSHDRFDILKGKNIYTHIYCYYYVCM